MLDRLLESRSRRPRSPVGAMVSVTAHTALIAAAVYATAQARIPPRLTPETMRPVYFPRIDDHAPSVPPVSTSPSMPDIQRIPAFVPPAGVTPGVDLTDVLSRANDFPPALPVGSISPASGGVPAAPAGTVLSGEQVEKQVTVAPGNEPPRYPEALRNAGVAGQVLAMFVVDERGRAEDSTVRFLRSDSGLFEDAVRAALRRMRFIPAEAGGRKVRQLVQMPFVFTLTK